MENNVVVGQNGKPRWCCTQIWGKGYQIPLKRTQLCPAWALPERLATWKTSIIKYVSLSLVPTSGWWERYWGMTYPLLLVRILKSCIWEGCAHGAEHWMQACCFYFSYTALRSYKAVTEKRNATQEISFRLWGVKVGFTGIVMMFNSCVENT